MGNKGKRLLAVVLFALGAFAGSASARGRQPPALRFALDPAAVGAGNTLSVTLLSDSPVEKASLSFRHRKIDFYPVGPGEWRALLGISSVEKPGRKVARFSAAFSRRRVHQSTFSFIVEPVDFPAGHIKLPKPKDGLVERMERDAKILDAVYRAARETEKLWDGLFTMPSTGVVSSVFGARRLYGPRKSAQPHTGVDIANRTGTAIVAPNRGRAAFVGWLDSFGHSVVLDHGQGVFSYYLHMTETFVKEGALVEKGTPLGSMGAEGVATGPHLHWSFVVGGERVDALEWTRREFR